MYMYFITSTLILITSPTTILNSSINSFCLIDTALILTSDNFHTGEERYKTAGIASGKGLDGIGEVHYIYEITERGLVSI